MIAGGLAAILAVGAGVMLSGKDEKPAADPVASAQKHEQPLPRVSVARVGQSSVTTDIQITGTIEARNTLPIGVEGEGGRITAVYADVGDRVQAGQVLAQISVDVIAQQIAQMNASLDEARANASIAKGMPIARFRSRIAAPCPRRRSIAVSPPLRRLRRAPT
ncbi:biotin/lipoyl-binding protein [Hankyongella ginsenosidimutans]|uniref:biotin/lipoyl-binding protein n=1 Tax=Hankyongella ginsenosidimutans TaxID=1763828 RepID=UPI001CA36C4A|nr:biotin/lipoyl-binding protein [Hankyongella ginsenosidimutans]